VVGLNKALAEAPVVVEAENVAEEDVDAVAAAEVTKISIKITPSVLK
jgi:hypothetical protein